MPPPPYGRMDASCPTGACSCRIKADALGLVLLRDHQLHQHPDAQQVELVQQLFAVAPVRAAFHAIGDRKRIRLFVRAAPCGGKKKSEFSQAFFFKQPTHAVVQVETETQVQLNTGNEDKELMKIFKSDGGTIIDCDC